MLRNDRAAAAISDGTGDVRLMPEKGGIEDLVAVASEKMAAREMPEGSSGESPEGPSPIADAVATDMISALEKGSHEQLAQVIENLIQYIQG